MTTWREYFKFPSGYFVKKKKHLTVSLLTCRFYLGGPTSIRGFSMYSMGPQSDGKTKTFISKVEMWCSALKPLLLISLASGDFLGGEAYWAGGLHLYTPLPFRPGRGGFGDLFRTHFFLNAGNLCNLNYGEAKTARALADVCSFLFLLFFSPRSTKIPCFVSVKARGLRHI